MTRHSQIRWENSGQWFGMGHDWSRWWKWRGRNDQTRAWRVFSSRKWIESAIARAVRPQIVQWNGFQGSTAIGDAFDGSSSSFSSESGGFSWHYRYRRVRLEIGIRAAWTSELMAFSMLNHNHANAIELQENDEEILRGEKDIRLRDDLVMNDQAEAKAKKRTVLQENSRGQCLVETKRGGWLNKRRAKILPKVPFPRTIDSWSILPVLADRFVWNHQSGFSETSSKWRPEWIASDWLTKRPESAGQWSNSVARLFLWRLRITRWYRLLKMEKRGSMEVELARLTGCPDVDQQQLGELIPCHRFPHR